MLADGPPPDADRDGLHFVQEGSDEMAMLTPTGLCATVRALLLCADRRAGLESERRDAVELDWTGLVGEAHGGLTRPSCSRVARQYPRGTEIRNVRQLTAVSLEELEAVRAAMDAPRLLPEWLGANLVVEGLRDLSALPPSSRLIGERGASLVVDMENAPCAQPAEAIERRLPGLGGRFPKAAVGRRGVTLWVERPGPLAVGETLSLHVPPPVRWRPPGPGAGPSRPARAV